MRRRANYGVDAPGLVWGLILVGVALAAAAIAGLAWPNHIPAALALAAGVLAAVLLGYAAVMLGSSLVGKKHVRDELVAALALSPGERVLDAGCGLGLALIGCAKELTTGKAVGIDLWTRDLSNNGPHGALANAAAEGVADRVEVQTGDITRLPFCDASFDAIVSMSVIHNIHPADQRDQALGELARVLKPGGRIALFDLLHARRYAEVLSRTGMQVRLLGHHRLWLFPGDSLIAQKPPSS